MVASTLQTFRKLWPMRVQVLGCSGGIGGELRTTSLMIDEDILIDCGTGVCDLEIDALKKLRHVFITHSHLDHIAALPLLIDTIFESLCDQPLILHTQPATFRILKDHIFNWHIWPDFFELPDRHNPAIIFQPLAAGETCELDGRSIAMIPVNHTVPGCGYRIEDASGALAFSGDTTTNDSLWAALNDYQRLDLLIIECAFAERDRRLGIEARHYCPSLLAADLQKLHHRPRISISHLQPGREASILAELSQLLPHTELSAAYNGEVFQL